MRNPIVFAVVGAFAATVGLTALPSCTAVLPPAMYPSPTVSTPVGVAVTFTGDVVPVLKEHCASCHSAGGMGAGAVTMFDAAAQPQYEAIKNHIGDMVAAIRAGRMPMGKPNSVPKEQLAKLEAWQAEGSPASSTSVDALLVNPAAAPAPAASTEPPSSPTPEPSPSPSPRYSSDDDDDDDDDSPPSVSFRTQVVPILEQHCKSCHGPSGPGSFAMFDGDGNAQYGTIKTWIGTMLDAIETRRIPTSLSAEEFEVLQDWKNAGKLNN